MSDMKEQLAIECCERGEIMDKLIALLFDMFRSYEYSFDLIIANEIEAYK